MVSMEEIPPLNICHAVAPVRDDALPLPSTPAADRRVGAEVIEWER